MPLLPLPNCQRTNRKTSIPKLLSGVILRHNLGWAEAGPNERDMTRNCFKPSRGAAVSPELAHKAIRRNNGTRRGTTMLGAVRSIVKDRQAKKFRIREDGDNEVDGVEIRRVERVKEMKRIYFSFP